LETVNKTLKMLRELGTPIIGIIENMSVEKFSVKEQVKTFNIPFLGEIGFDPKLEGAIGDASELLKTDFVKSMSKIIESTDEFRLNKTG